MKPIAIGHYDRHLPIIDGTIERYGYEVKVVGQTIEELDGSRRHQRFLAREFDVAEMSLSSYLMAKSRGAEICAIPVFPRRLCWEPLVFVPVKSHLEDIRQLRWGKVIINSFQTTLSVRFKGDLARAGLSWREVKWFTMVEEPVEFDVSSEVQIERLNESAKNSWIDMLARGEFDAIVHPHPPKELLDVSRFRCLFRDPLAELRRHVDAFNGAQPIMHVIALQNEAVAEKPELPGQLQSMFVAALREMDRHYLDPNWSIYLVGRWGTTLGSRWENGLNEDNRRDLEEFVEDSADQGLIDGGVRVSDLFVTSS